MAMSDERIAEITFAVYREAMHPCDYTFARAIEAETRKADTELIRQMLDALCLLESADVVLTERGWEVTNAAITAARERLKEG